MDQTKVRKTKHHNALPIYQFVLLLLVVPVIMVKTALRCMEIYAHSMKSSACIPIVPTKVKRISSFARKTTDALKP
jgi:hypothetical protein